MLCFHLHRVTSFNMVSSGDKGINLFGRVLKLIMLKDDASSIKCGKLHVLYKRKLE